MSENYEIVDRLRLDAGALEEDDWLDVAACMREAATRITEQEARITELEAEATSHRQIEEMVLRDKATRIAELEAEVDAERRWRKVCLDGSAKRIAELEAAVLAEREACAQTAYEWLTFSSVGRDIAAALRAKPSP